MISQWPRNSKIFINPIIEDSVKDHFLKENKNELIINRMMVRYKLLLPDDILCKIDRAAMQFDLRLEFHLLVEKYLNFHKNYQSIKNKNKGKVILRNILSNFIPIN